LLYLEQSIPGLDTTSTDESDLMVEVQPSPLAIQQISDCRVLIIDDCSGNIRLLETMLRRHGFHHILGHTESIDALSLYRNFQPDILLLDMHMPQLEGIDVLDLIRTEVPIGHYFPVLILTGDADQSLRKEALLHGATDFLTKPYDMMEVLLRIRNLLQTRILHQRLRLENELLESRVRERTRNLEEARIEVLERLARAAEFRDDDTCQHTIRVGRNSGTLARQLGLLDSTTELIERAAPLHDIGKIGIPDAILLKKGKLTPEEFDIMKTHSAIGARILSDGRSPLIRMAEQIALTHHEAWNGSGYPNGLTQDRIPISGRIVTVVDVFDALTHERPYKKAWSVEEALDWITSRKGILYDPEIVEVFSSGIQFGRYIL
jgi:putative two-component system response regulator